MTEHKTICKLLYKGEKITSAPIFIFILSIIFIFLTIYQYITIPDNSGGVIFPSIKITKIHSLLFGIFMSVLTMLMAIIMKFNIKNKIKNYIYNIISLSMIVIGIFEVFFAICLLNLIWGIIFTSIIMTATIIFACWLRNIRTSCPKLNNIGV